MVSVVIVDPIEQIDHVCQELSDFRTCLGAEMNDLIEMQYFQVKKSLAVIRNELRKLGYSEL